MRGILGNHFANTVHLTIGQSQNTPHIAQRRAGLQRSKGDNLGHTIIPIPLLHVPQDLVPTILAKINIKIGHGHPLGIQKPLKQQIPAQGVQICNVQTPRHQRSRPRSPTWAHGYALLFGPCYKIRDNQKISRKSHADDDIQLISQPLFIGQNHNASLFVFPLLGTLGQALF